MEFSSVSARVSLHMAPSFLGSPSDMNRGIHTHLSSLLMKYVPVLGGIPVACHRFSPCSERCVTLCLD